MAAGKSTSGSRRIGAVVEMAGAGGDGGSKTSGQRLARTSRRRQTQNRNMVRQSVMTQSLAKPSRGEAKRRLRALPSEARADGAEEERVVGMGEAEKGVGDAVKGVGEAENTDQHATLAAAGMAEAQVWLDEQADHLATSTEERR